MSTMESIRMVRGRELPTGSTNLDSLTEGLLVCGSLIAPLFFGVVFLQSFTRAGFDLRRAPLSLLSLGDLGWIQIANFMITGLLGSAFAMGVRRALTGSRGGTWGPLLIGVYGLGLILAGLFHPDPGYGFPPGTGAPAVMLPVMSAHAVVHSLGFLIVVLSLIASCFVFARRFWSRGEKGWSIYSLATGILAPVLIATGVSTNTIPLITVMAVMTFGWLSFVATRLRAQHKEDSQ